jgi:RNA polymerase sigma-70 factor (ECF subfamily)
MERNTSKKHELKRLIVPLFGKLNKVAMFLCRDKDMAEDLVAETLLKACEKINTLKDKSKFKSWIFRIMNNTFISNLRAEKKLNLVQLDDYVLNKDTGLTGINKQTLGLWGPNPENYLINKLLDEDIKKGIHSLPEEFRLVVILCDIENLSYKEISEIIRVPVGTVRSRLSRGRAILQKKLHHLALEMGIVQKKERNSKAAICNCN